MRDGIAYLFGMILSIFFVVELTWELTANDLALTHYFAPRYEAVRRETFEQSKAYNQGMIQELENMEFQYEQADDAHKQALAAIIRHRAADFDRTKLPDHLASFIATIENHKVYLP